MSRAPSRRTSLTKEMFAVLVTKLVERGVLDLGGRGLPRKTRVPTHIAFALVRHPAPLLA